MSHRFVSPQLTLTLCCVAGCCGPSVPAAGSVKVLARRHHGMPALQVATHETFREHQTRYCFDGSVYVPLAARVRQLYDHRRKMLRHVLRDSHWEPWRPLADSSCRPL